MLARIGWGIAVFVSGTLLGAGLIGWSLTGTVRRQMALSDEAVEQIQEARQVNQECRMALETVWDGFVARVKARPRIAYWGNDRELAVLGLKLMLAFQSVEDRAQRLRRHCVG